MKNKLFTIGLPLAMAVSIFIGCASMGGGETAPSGTLAITGIPAESEGKFVRMAGGEFRIQVTNDEGKKSNVTVTVQDSDVKNGEVKLPLYIKEVIAMPFGKPKGYAGSDTVSAVEIGFYSTPGDGSRGTDAAFESVTFKDGAAVMQWNDAAKAGRITVTGIPAEYNGREAKIYMGWNRQNPNSGEEWMSNLIVMNGSITGKCFPVERVNSRVQENKNMSYTFTGTKDIAVIIDNGKESSFLTIGLDSSKDYFLFKNVQITNGKADFDFRRGGVKQ
jgi:hypothetical protein